MAIESETSADLPSVRSDDRITYSADLYRRSVHNRWTSSGQSGSGLYWSGK